MKRTRYTIQIERETAKFSSLRHAMLFALHMSKSEPGLVEISAKDGLVGQYQRGKLTPEFESHHIDGIFH